MQERLSTLRAMCQRRWDRQVERPVLCDPLEPRMMMSATATAAAAVSYSTTLSAYRVIAADLDGDGHQDLIANNWTSNSATSGINVLWGNENGAFLTALSMKVGTSITSVVAADVNGDGSLDLIFTDRDSHTLGVMLNNASTGNPVRSFQDATYYDMGSGTPPSSVAVGDFNGDGAVDLAVACYANNSVRILTGNKTNKVANGTFTLSSTAYQAGVGPSSIAVADMNKDGAADLIVANTNSDDVSILLGKKTNGKANGTFASAVNYTVGDNPLSVVTGDFNGDGYADVAVASGGVANSVSVLLNNKNGTLTLSDSYAAGSYPTGLSVTDVNNDGVCDLAVLDQAARTYDILIGKPDGTFHSVIQMPTGANGSLSSITFADLNGDGKQDLITADTTNKVLAVSLNNTSQISKIFTAAKSYSYVDSSGDTVTLKLTGPGMVEVTLDSTTAASNVGLELFGTTTASSLTVTVTNPSNPSSDKLTKIKTIDLGSGSLGSLNAAGVDIDYNGSITGGSDSIIRNIVVHDLCAGATVELNGTLSGGINITARLVDDSAKITLTHCAINAATFADVRHVSITALSINTLKSTGVKGNLSLVGDFHAFLTLTGNTNSKAYTLGTATIAGAVGESTWTITGKANALAIGTVSNATITVTGSVNTLAVAGNFSSISKFAVDSIGKMTVGGSMFNFSGFTANSVGSLSVAGDLYSGGITLGGSGIDSNDYAIQSLTVGGGIGVDMGGGLSFTVTHGRVGVISANSMLNSGLTVSDGTIDKILVAHDMTGIFISAYAITTMDVKGNIAGTTRLTIGTTALEGKTVLNSLTVGGDIHLNEFNVTYGNVGVIKADSVTSLPLVVGSSSTNHGTLGKLLIAKNADSTYVTATSINTVDIGGSLSKAQFIVGSDNTVGKTVLGSFTVDGDVTGTIITNTNRGNFGTITAGSLTSSNTSSTSINCVDGSINALTVKGNMNMDSGSMVAASIGTWKVGGDLANLLITQFGSVDMAGKYAINSLSVTGLIINTELVRTAAGNINTIHAGNLSSVKFTFADAKVGSITVDGYQLSGSLTCATLGNWTVGGPLEAVTATIDNSTLLSKVSLNSLSVKGAINALTLTVTQGDIGSITGGSLQDSTITAYGSRITKIALTKNAKLSNTGNWTNTDFSAKAVQTYSVGGDMTDSDLVFGTSSLTDREKNLGALTVAGNVSHTKFYGQDGQVGDLKFGTLTDSAISFTQDINSLNVTGDMKSTTASYLTVSARSIVNWTVGGNVHIVKAILGDSTTASFTTTGARKTVLNKLTVGGTLSVSTISTYGSIGAISAKELDTTEIYAGYSSTKDAHTSYETIGSLVITGDKISVPSASNSTIAAWKFGTIAITYPGNDMVQSEIRGTMINSFSVTRLNGTANVKTNHGLVTPANVGKFSETGIALSLYATPALVS